MASNKQPFGDQASCLLPAGRHAKLPGQGRVGGAVDGARDGGRAAGGRARRRADVVPDVVASRRGCVVGGVLGRSRAGGVVLGPNTYTSL